ncbi:hypothetical protein ACHAO1_010230 [Botrytis cinerea]
MSGHRRSERRARDSHQSSSLRQYHGSERSRQEPPRQNDQQRSPLSASHYHGVGPPQHQYSANHMEFNDYMTSNPRDVSDDVADYTRYDPWEPAHPYVGMSVLNRPMPPGTEPVALNVGRNPSVCEVCNARPPINSTESYPQWKWKHLNEKNSCRLGMSRIFNNAPVVTEVEGGYLHGQAFADSNDHEQMAPPASIPTYPSIRPPAAQNTYSSAQGQNITQYTPQQPQPPYFHQPPTVQPFFAQELYDQYDDEYDNEQLDNIATANETASGPGWGVEPSVIIPRSTYSNSERRGYRGVGRNHR